MEKDLEQHKKIYQSFFETENGRYILEDLKKAFCVHSDLLVNSNNKELDNHHKEGLRIAFNYILKPY